MKALMGIEYGRSATANIVTSGGPALGPSAVKEMFPNADWTTVIADPYDANLCATDRFGDCFNIQKKIFAATPFDTHVMIGGDHSVNFGHFAALADRMADEELCLIYIDAHLDIHTPQSSQAEASGAPHGTNVRALLGDGDARWLGLQKRKPALLPQNLFYLASRSYEPSEIKFVRDNNIYIRTANELSTPAQWAAAISEIRKKIGARNYIVSFDFDAIDPSSFSDVLVPEPAGISTDAAEYFVRELSPDAYSFEFVEYAPTGDESSHEIVKKLVGIAADYR